MTACLRDGLRRIGVVQHAKPPGRQPHLLSLGRGLSTSSTYGYKGAFLKGRNYVPATEVDETTTG